MVSQDSECVGRSEFCDLVPKEQVPVDNQFYERAIEGKKTVDDFKQKIRQKLENDGVLTSLQNSILDMTVYYEDLDDEDIAQRLGQKINAHEIKVQRAKALEELLGLYHDVLVDHMERHGHLLNDIFESTLSKLQLVKDYRESNWENKVLGARVDEHERGVMVGTLISHYLEVLVTHHAEVGGEYQSIGELERETGYAGDHIRSLVRDDLVMGVRTARQLYVRRASLERYQARNNQRGAPRGPRRQPS